MDRIVNLCENKCPKCLSKDIDWLDSHQRGDIFIYEGRCEKCGTCFEEKHIMAYAQSEQKPDQESEQKPDQESEQKPDQEQKQNYGMTLIDAFFPVWLLVKLREKQELKEKVASETAMTGEKADKDLRIALDNYISKPTEWNLTLLKNYIECYHQMKEIQG